MVLTTLEKQLFEGESRHKSPQADSTGCPWWSLPVKAEQRRPSSNLRSPKSSIAPLLFNSEKIILVYFK